MTHPQRLARAVSSSLLFAVAACGRQPGAAAVDANGMTSDPSVESRPGPCAGFAVFDVDEDAAPFAKQDDTTPTGISLHVAFDDDRKPMPAFVKVDMRPGDSLADAWKRAKPWLITHPLPSGDMWTWQVAFEPDNEGVESTYHAVGFTTLVIVDKPIVTKADVADAEPKLEGDWWIVRVRLTEQGRERLRSATARTKGRRLAIVLDTDREHVSTAPVHRTEIGGGEISFSWMTSESRSRTLSRAPSRSAADRRVVPFPRFIGSASPS